MAKKMYAVYGLILLVFVASQVVAQQHGKGMMYHMYDVKTETTVSGTVDEIITESHPCCGKTMDHYYITVKTAAETIKIFLGPTDYVTKQITLKKGDSITVVGSKTTLRNEAVIIAKKINVNKTDVVFRNDDGTPTWAGQMQQHHHK
jgi:Trk K+ transport system NAD-binding subunit